MIGLIPDVMAQPVTPATSANIAEQEQRRVEGRQRALREQQERSADIRLPNPAASPSSRLPEGELPCFVIKNLQLQILSPDKSTAGDFAWILAGASGLVNPSKGQVGDSPIGRCLGTQGINKVLSRVQDYIVSRGYITTRVLAAPQDLSAGVLTLTVVPGRIKAVRFTPEGVGYANDWTADAALPAGVGDLVNLRDVEQALENFKRVPTVNADIQIQPAEVLADTANALALGQSDLVIKHQQGRPVRATLSLDDSGSQVTSRFQAGFTFSYDNPLALNDLFYFSLNQGVLGSTLGGASPGERGTSGTIIHYSVPVGYWLVGATASTSAYRQTVAGASQTYLYRGTSSNADVKLSRLVYRDAYRKSTLSIRAFKRTSSNFIDDTEIQVQKRVVGGFEVAANHREFIELSGGQATLDLDVAFKRGTGAFGALPAPEEAFGEGTSRMKVTTASITFNAPLKGLGDFGRNLRYSGSLRLQANQTPLTPQDRFAIGGRYSVRGFDGESALVGERGGFFRNDLIAALGESGHAAYLGLDYGKVGGLSTAGLAGKSLIGTVLGLRGAIEGVQYDVFVGTPLKKPDLFKTASVTAGFLVNYSF